jgi:nitrite reductase (NADH) small subunit
MSIDNNPTARRCRPRFLDDGWTSACPLTTLIPGRGVAVLLRGGAQAALFLLDDGTLRAVDNIDPYGRAAVMSRGLVGEHGGEPTVASPLLKQVFSLSDGRALAEPAKALAVYEVRVRDGVVQIRPNALAAALRHCARNEAEPQKPPRATPPLATTPMRELDARD